MPNWNDYAELGMLRAVLDPNDTKGFKNRLLDQIHWNCIRPAIQDAQRLLDFGCGTGRFAARIAQCGIEYTGVDNSINMIEGAKKYHASLETSFAQLANFHIPFPSASFDTCLSVCVLQYIRGTQNVATWLTEIRRVLEPRGRFVLLEQASLSNQTSGTVSVVSTERDYTDELSRFFQVESVARIRSGRLSRVSSESLRLAEYMPIVYGRLLNNLANLEIRRAVKAPDSYYARIEYYDVMITCTVSLSIQ